MEKYKIDLNIQADVVIVGTGVSGLYATLNLPHDKKIVMIHFWHRVEYVFLKMKMTMTAILKIQCAQDIMKTTKILLIL